MPQSEDEGLGALEARLARDDPRFARALGAGRPTRPREYRRTGAWWMLTGAIAVLITGIVVADGLLIAAGLVLTGIAGQLFDPHRPRAGRRCPPRR